MKNVTTMLFFIIVMGIAYFTPGAQPRMASAEESASAEAGKALFQAKCSSCHTVGAGKLVGPDLKGVTALRDHAWLVKFISSPDKVLAGGDPVAGKLLKEYGGVAMPNLGLSTSQVDALLAYLVGSTSQKVPALPVVSTVVTAGDPERGAKLFTGIIPFKLGGAPCVACHTVSGVAPLGGGSLGPDLTGIYGRLGPAGLPTILASLPFPTMQPIFQTRPLTAPEREDLAALFQATASRKPVDNATRLTVLALAGLVLLLLLAAVIWRKRLKSVRGALVAAMTEAGGDQR